MKKILFILFLLPLISVAQNGRYNPVPQKTDFQDSIKLSKYKNSVGEDSVLSTDVNGRIKPISKIGLVDSAKYKTVFQARQDSITLTKAINLKLDITDTIGKFPRIQPGTNVTITGTPPNFIINATGGGGADTSRKLTADRPIILYQRGVDTFVVRADTTGCDTCLVTRWQLNKLAVGDFSDGLVSAPPLTLVDSTLTVNSTIIIRRSGVNIPIAMSSAFIIQKAAPNYKRLDVVYANASNVIDTVRGIPDTSIAPLPSLPVGAIQIAIVRVDGSTISTPIPSVSNRNWLLDGNNIVSGNSYLGPLTPVDLNLGTRGVSEVVINGLNGNVSFAHDIVANGGLLFNRLKGLNFAPTGNIDNINSVRYGVGFFHGTTVNFNNTTNKEYDYFLIDPTINHTTGNSNNRERGIHYRPTKTATQGVLNIAYQNDVDYNFLNAYSGSTQIGDTIPKPYKLYVNGSLAVHPDSIPITTGEAYSIVQNSLGQFKKQLIAGTSQNFANTDLSASGDRSHNFKGFQFFIDSLGFTKLRSKYGGQYYSELVLDGVDEGSALRYNSNNGSTGSEIKAQIGYIGLTTFSGSAGVNYLMKNNSIWLTAINNRDSLRVQIGGNNNDSVQAMLHIRGNAESNPGDTNIVKIEGLPLGVSTDSIIGIRNGFLKIVPRPSSGSSYTAGLGLNLSSNIFSLDTSNASVLSRQRAAATYVDLTTSQTISAGSGKKAFTGTSNFPLSVTGNAGGGIIAGAYDATLGGIWSNAVTPSTSNYLLIGNSSLAIINAPSGGTVSQSINNTAVTTTSNTGMAVTGVLSSTGQTTSQSLMVNGTGGAGYIDLLAQSSNPSTPAANHMYFFGDANGKMSWKTSLGFTRKFSSYNLTADREYRLQDKSHTIADSADVAAKLNASDSAAIYKTKFAAYQDSLALATQRTRPGLVFKSTDTMTVFGHSWTTAVGATTTAQGFIQEVANQANCVLDNRGVSGLTLMRQVPFNWAGAGTNMQTLLSTIPTKTVNQKLLVFMFGLNDYGQTASAYSATNYALSWDSLITYAIGTKGWTRETILIMQGGWIGYAGLTGYGVATGNAAPTKARQDSFNAIDKAQALKYGTLFFDTYNQQLKNGDTTAMFDTRHPNDAGYLQLAKSKCNFLGITYEPGRLQVKSTAPSSFSTNWAPVLMGTSAAIYGTIGSNNLVIDNNFYLNGAGSLVYRNTGAANFIQLSSNGDITFNTVASGAANAGLGTTRTSTFSAAGSLSVPTNVTVATGVVAARNYYGTSATPAIVAGAGAGTGPTVSIAGSNAGGTITITTGTLPTASATVATITFSGSFAYPTGSSIILYPANANAAALNGAQMVFTNGTTTGWTLSSSTTFLTAATTYIWNFKSEGY